MAPTLVLPDGRRVELDGDLVLGRAPIAPESSPSARSISLSVATISKTHVLIGHDAGGVWLVDLNSSNGTEVIDAVGMSESAVPGHRLVVPSGSHIRVGTDTVITVEGPIGSDHDRVDDDLDRTVSVRPSGSVLAPDAPAVSDAARSGAAVDWSSVTDPEPSAPAVAEPVAPTSWAPRPPPPVQPSFSPQPPPPAPPVAAYVDPAGPPPSPSVGGPLPAGPHVGFPHAGFAPSAAPQAEFPSAASAGGRSPAHAIGAAVLLVWSVVVFLGVRDWLPDFFVRAIDFRAVGLFVAPARNDLRFQEYFSFISLPEGLDFLSWAAEIGPLVAVASAVVALVVPRAAMRWIVVALVAIPMILNIGLLVSVGLDDLSILTDNIDRFAPWFVLPFVGSVLLLWPERRSAAGPTQQPGVFYDSSQPSAPRPPGPGASPFS